MKLFSGQTANVHTLTQLTWNRLTSIFVVKTRRWKRWADETFLRIVTESKLLRNKIKLFGIWSKFFFWVHTSSKQWHFLIMLPLTLVLLWWYHRKSWVNRFPRSRLYRCITPIYIENMLAVSRWTRTLCWWSRRCDGSPCLNAQYWKYCYQKPNVRFDFLPQILW